MQFNMGLPPAYGAPAQRALFRLHDHVPPRAWAAAPGAVPTLPAERDHH